MLQTRYGRHPVFCGLDVVDSHMLQTGYGRHPVWCGPAVIDTPCRAHQVSYTLLHHMAHHTEIKHLPELTIAFCVPHGVSTSPASQHTGCLPHLVRTTRGVNIGGAYIHTYIHTYIHVVTRENGFLMVFCWFLMVFNVSGLFFDVFFIVFYSFWWF